MKKLAAFLTTIFVLGAFAAGLIPYAIKGIQAEQAQREQEGILRLHIRAKDNSAEEQARKLLVRDAVLAYTNQLTADCENKDEASEKIEANLKEIQRISMETIAESGSGLHAEAQIAREWFDYREYDGFFLPEGEYDALVVTIGEGAGDNWWCVVFPAACYVGASETVETAPERMPARFRLARGKNTQAQPKFYLFEKIKGWFTKSEN